MVTSNFVSLKFSWERHKKLYNITGLEIFHMKQRKWNPSIMNQNPALGFSELIQYLVSLSEHSLNGFGALIKPSCESHNILVSIRNQEKTSSFFLPVRFFSLTFFFLEIMWDLFDVFWLLCSCRYTILHGTLSVHAQRASFFHKTLQKGH